MALNRYGWNEAILKIHFDRAVALGWVSYMRQFAIIYDIPTARQLAIASRETNMKNIRGDYSRRPGEPRAIYHGYGPMQVDVNTDIAFTRRWIAAVNKNDIVREAIEVGVKILKAKYRYLANNGLVDPVLTQYALGAYNGGEGRALRAYRDGRSADSITTKRNYSSDVLEREKIFAQFLDRL